MGSIPWYVVHGGWLGVLAPVLLALVVVAVFAQRARRRAAREAAAARARLGPPRDVGGLEDGAVVCVAGRLDAEGSCECFADGAPVAAATADDVGSAFVVASSTSVAARAAQAPRLCVIVGEVRVDLDGPVRVVAGADEHLPGTRRAFMPTATDRRLRAARQVPGTTDGSGDFQVLRSIGSGTEVLVRGRLQRGAAESMRGGTGYRAPAERWSLHPPADGPILLAARAAPRLTMAASAVTWRRALPALAASVALSLAFGYIADVRGLDAAASLSPFTRAAALRGLRYQVDLDEHPRSLRGRAQDRVLLNELLADCAGEAEALKAHGQLRRAAERWEVCARGATDPRERFASWRSAGNAWAMLGEFERASEAAAARPSVPANSEQYEGFWARVHMLAGRFDRAAAAMETYIGTVEEPAASAAAKCEADALRHRAGDAAALGRLAESKVEACIVLHAELLHGQARLDRLAQQGADQTEQQHGRLALLLAADAGDTKVAWAPANLPARFGGSPRALLAGSWYVRAHAMEQRLLERLAAEASPTDAQRSIRQNLATYAALFEMQGGDGVAAQRWAKLAEEDLEQRFAAPLPQRELRHGTGMTERLTERMRVRAMRVLVALRRGDAAGAAELMRPWPTDVDHYLATYPPLHVGDAGVSSARARELDEDQRKLFRTTLGFELVPVLVELHGLVAIANGSADYQEAAVASFEAAGKRAERRAAGGDAAAFATWLRGEKSRPCVSEELTAAALRLAPARDAVLEWLEVGACWRRESADAARLNETAWLAWFAERMGAPAFAEDNRAIAERYRRALTAPGIAIPLAVMR